MTKRERAALAQKAFKNRSLPQDICAREIGIGYVTFRMILKGEEVFRKKPDKLKMVQDWIDEWANKEG